MKKTLTVAVLLATSFVARADSLRAHIPFAFSATGTSLPAGEYSISAMPNSSSILLIEGSGMQALVFGRIVAETSAKAPPLVFEKGALIGVSASGKRFELSITAKPSAARVASIRR